MQCPHTPALSHDSICIVTSGLSILLHSRCVHCGQIVFSKHMLRVRSTRTGDDPTCAVALALSELSPRCMCPRITNVLCFERLKSSNDPHLVQLY
ncbi:hypothetical protein PENSPDRAFT_90720 [Peniophora sp. CONT]|nr:hypothetical protein PENSPDRAFT_90720 [Peniophora sp. CONT]